MEIPGIDSRRTLALVYDRGAATPYESVCGLSGLAELIIVLGPSAHALEFRPFFEEYGEVLALEDGRDSTLRELRARGTAGVVTFSESMITDTAWFSEHLALPGHSCETAINLTDKEAQRRQLSAKGVDDVRYRALTSVDEWDDAQIAVGLPCIVKPTTGQGSRNVFYADANSNGRQLISEALRTESRLLVEEFLRGRISEPYGEIISVESVVSNGAVSHLGVSGRLPPAPPFRSVGQFRPSQLTPEEEGTAFALAGDAIEALGVTSGIIHTELKLTPQCLRIIEVNGRLGGYQVDLYRRAAGLDLAEVAGRLALGEDVRLETNRPNEVYFQFYVPSPVTPCTLTEVRGGDDVTGMPGVTAYRRFLRPGTFAAGGVGFKTIDRIDGHTATHMAMIELIGQIADHLTYVFETQDGQLVLTGRQLIGQ